MAYEPTQWRSGDTITSERLNKMEQGIAGGGSGEFYALHTTVTATSDGNNNITYTYSSVELQESGLPIFLVVEEEVSSATAVNIYHLVRYDDTSVSNAAFRYADVINNDMLTVDRQTGEVSVYQGLN